MDKKNEKLNVEVFDYSTIARLMQEHGKFCLWLYSSTNCNFIGAVDILADKEKTA